MSRLTSLVAAVAFGASLVFVPAARASARHHDAVPSTGLAGIAFDKSPPDVVFDTGDGARPLSSRFGRPLVLNFWATWCGPCVAELDQFAEARDRYGNGVSIVTISNEAPGVGAQFLASHGLLFPVVDDASKRLEKAFGVTAVPVTLVLRPDGTVFHVSVGELDPGELIAALAALVAPATPVPGTQTSLLQPSETSVRP